MLKDKYIEIFTFVLVKIKIIIILYLVTEESCIKLIKHEREIT